MGHELSARRVFRLFVSSTFADFVHERQALQQSVFPRLRAYCEGRGALFQPIDLRWGISEEAALDQQTMRRCLDEIRRCQLETRRPNFLVLLGSRYGWRPLPEVIPTQEFEALRAKMTPAERSAASLYRRDDNAVPPHYGVPGRSSTRSATHVRKDELERWSEAAARARAALVAAVDRLGWPADDPRRWKYEDSATHAEIRLGTLKGPAPDGAALVYVREFEQPPRSGDEGAGVFIDLAEGELDTAATERLRALRESLRERLEVTGLYRTYRVTNHQALRAERPDAATAAGIRALCESIERDLRTVIDEELERGDNRTTRESSEAAAHAQFAAEHSAGMVGRRAALSRVNRYLLGAARVPFVVEGVSGSGKTTLMAKASVEASDSRLDCAPVVVARFVGASPRSTSLPSLVGDLCAEIAAAYDDATRLPSDPELVTAHLAAHAMKLARADRPLWLFLDDLEQLMGEPAGRELEWLPRRLPPHVKVVLSAASAARARWPSSVMMLGGLDAAEANELLAAQLRESGRTLQPRQLVHVRARVARNGLPLYLKLAIDEVRGWKSWEGLPRSAAGKAGLPSTVGGIVSALLERLSLPREHGPVLVRSVFAYLGASRHGLAEDEIVELLSADRRVMQDFIHHSPTERAKPPAQRVEQLPWIVWSRLEGDLAPYLMRRGIDGVEAVSFFHRQLHEAAGARQRAAARRAHHALSRYFRSRADPAKDASWSGTDARGFANLSFHLARGAQPRALRRVLLDSRWLQSKLQRLGIAALLEDFSWLPLERSAALVKQALELSRDALATPQPQLAAQLLGRLQDLRSPPIRALLERARAAATRSAFALQPLSRSLAPPNAAQIRVLRGHQGEVEAVALTPDGRLTVSCSFDALKIWNLATGALLRTIEREGPLWAVAVTPDGQLVLVAHDNTVECWDVATGRRARPTLRGHGHAINAIAISRDGRLAITTSSDSTAKSWDLASGECVATFSGHTNIVRGVVLSPDGQLAYSGSNDRTVRAWDPRSGVPRQGSLAHDDFVFSVAISDDGGHLLTGAGDGALRLWDLRKPEPTVALAAHDGFVYDAVFLGGSRRAASGGYDHLVRVWQLDAPRRAPKVLAGHAGPVNALAATRDGRRLVSGSWDGTVRVWDTEAPVEAGDEARHLMGIRALAVTRDGRLALSVADDRRLRIWDLATRESSVPLPALQAPLAITPDGSVALTSGAEDYARELVAIDLGTRTVLWRRPYFDEGEGAYNWTVNAIAITPDGKHALVGSTADELTIWEVATGKRLRKLAAHTGCINAVKIAPAAQAAVTGSNDGTVRLWPLDGKMRPTVLFEMDAIVSCIATTDHASTVVAAPLHEGQLIAWDRAAGKRRWTAGIMRSEQPTVPGYVAYVSDLDLTPDGRQLIIASEDHSLTVRELRDGTVRATFVGDTAMLACAVAPGGRLILGGERCGRLHFLRFEAPDLASAPP